jgi:hypothetical protein
MNKFNRLQLLGTLVVASPILIVLGGIVIYHTDFSSTKKVEVEIVETVAVAPKVATVAVIKEVPAPAPPPPPVVKKPTPPPAPAPPTVVRDTAIEVELKVAAELDTTK